MLIIHFRFYFGLIKVKIDTTTLGMSPHMYFEGAGSHESLATLGAFKGPVA